MFGVLGGAAFEADSRAAPLLPWVGNKVAMTDLRVVMDDDVAATLSGAVLFGILWDELADLLGTAATAAVLRRALRRALPHNAALAELAITRVEHEYGYVVPQAFGLSKGPPRALCDLLDELRPLLVELTGQVALRRLDEVPELRNWRSSPQPS